MVNYSTITEKISAWKDRRTKGSMVKKVWHKEYCTDRGSRERMKIQVRKMIEG
jgi:hypothetical protein